MSDTPLKSLAEHEEETRDTFNRLKPYYDATWDAHETTLHVGLFQTGKETLEEAYIQATERLFSTLQQELPLNAASCLLDIGCGAGRSLLLACERFGCRGIGIDVSDDQIEDAQQELIQRNKQRAQVGLPCLDVRFIRGSASDLKTLLAGQRYTHAMSQDAILLVGNKTALFQDLHEQMEPGGVLVACDFLEEQAELRETDQARLLYDVVRWQGGLSLSAYQSLLLASGFSKRYFERLDESMIRTYSLLADRLENRPNDPTYTTLQARYRAIVEAVQAGKMGWVFYSARKLPRKALLCGTKPSSIGRAVGDKLHGDGWDVWLCSRSAEHTDRHHRHERSCDLEQPQTVDRLLSEMGSPDAVFFFAAHDTGHEDLESSSPESLRQFCGAKITGALVLANTLLRQADQRAAQWVWCQGRPSQKPKELLTYSVANSAIAGFVEDVNRHYATRIQAYYISTGIISPSTLGDSYLHKHPEATPTENLAAFTQRVQGILRTQPPGIIGDLSATL